MNVYTGNFVRVAWCGVSSEYFQGINGLIQGGVLSYYFCVCVDNYLLLCLKQGSDVLLLRILSVLWHMLIILFLLPLCCSNAQNVTFVTFMQWNMTYPLMPLSQSVPCHYTANQALWFTDVVSRHMCISATLQLVVTLLKLCLHIYILVTWLPVTWTTVVIFLAGGLIISDRQVNNMLSHFQNLHQLWNVSCPGYTVWVFKMHRTVDKWISGNQKQHVNLWYECFMICNKLFVLPKLFILDDTVLFVCYICCSS